MEKIGNTINQISATLSPGGRTNNFGIELANGTERVAYNLTSGLIGAQLTDIKEARREIFESRVNKDFDKVPVYEDTFNFIYQVKDASGKILELVREVTKKISYTKIQSNLYKDLCALLPKEPRSAFQSPEGAAMVIGMLLTQCQEKEFPKAYLQIEKKDSGYVTVKAVLPVPVDSGIKINPKEPKKETKALTLDEDDIPFA